MSRTAVSSEQAPEALGPYSQAIVAGGSSSAPGWRASTRRPAAAPDEIEAQTAQALLNLAAVLSAAGASLQDIVKTTIFYDRRRRLRPSKRCLRPAYARSAAGAVRSGQRAVSLAACLSQSRRSRYLRARRRSLQPFARPPDGWPHSATGGAPGRHPCDRRREPLGRHRGELRCAL